MLYLKSLLKKVPTIMPDNGLKLIWDTGLLFLILLNTLIIPLSLSFDLETTIETNFFQNFDMAMVCLLTVDMLLSILTAYYSKGVIILKKAMILRNYFYHSFLWDFFSVIPYFLTPFVQSDFVKLLLMFRLIKMLKIFIGLEEHLFLSDKIKGFYEIFKLMLVIIYMGHFFACTWVYVAKIEIRNGVWNSWIQNSNLVDQDWSHQYISSLYFAVYTMVTVGYGDICPGNVIERAICIVLIILSCGVFAYSLNKFGTILEHMYRNENVFK